MEVLRRAATSPRFTFAVYAAILGIFLAAAHQLLSVWLLSERLHAELKSLSSRLVIVTVTKPLANDDDDAQSEILRLSRSVFSVARSASVEQLESSALSAQSTSLSASSEARYPPHTVLESLVVRAIPLSAEVTASQNAQASGSTGTFGGVIATNVRGAYSEVRSWLIEVTDADTDLLLSSVLFRRESSKHQQIVGELKFIGIGPLSGRR